MLIYYLSFSGLFNAITSTALGLLILFKNKEDKTFRIFAFFCFSVALWSYPYAFWPLTKNENTALFLFQILHIGPFYASVFYLHFVSLWLGVYQKTKKVVITGYVIATVFLFFVFSPYFIQEMVPKFGFRFWANTGFLYHFYLLLFFGYAFYSSYLLIVNYKKTSGLKRTQIKYILVGMSLAYLGGSTNYPMYYNIDFPPYGNILGSSYVILTAYAIAKHRLIDIRIALRTFYIYLGETIIAFLGLYFYLFVISRFFPRFYNIEAYILSSVFALIYIILIHYIHNVLLGSANNYLFRDLFDRQQLISGMSRKISSLAETDKIIDLILKTVIEAGGAKKAGLILKNRSEDLAEFEPAKVIGFADEAEIAFIKDQGLMNYLAANTGIITIDEIDELVYHIQGEAKESLVRLKMNMQKADSELLIPIVRKNNLIGVLILGKKYSDDAYSREEIGLLDDLSSQAAIAIENAHFYENIESRNEELRQKYEKQSLELKQKTEAIKKTTSIRQGSMSVISNELEILESSINNAKNLQNDKALSVDKKEALLSSSLDKSLRLVQVVERIIKNQTGQNSK